MDKRMNKINVNGYQHTTLRNRSLFNPPVGDNGHIEVYKRLATQALTKLEIRKSKVARDIELGIKHLENRKDIVIRPADKGGGTMVQTKEAYKTDLENQLKIRTHQRLLRNTTRTYRNQCYNIVKKGMNKGILNNKEGRYLVPDVCRIHVIHTVPKSHKNKENPPGCPIVNGI